MTYLLELNRIKSLIIKKVSSREVPCLIHPSWSHSSSASISSKGFFAVQRIFRNSLASGTWKRLNGINNDKFITTRAKPEEFASKAWDDKEKFVGVVDHPVEPVVFIVLNEFANCSINLLFATKWMLSLMVLLTLVPWFLPLALLLKRSYLSILWKLKLL